MTFINILLPVYNEELRLTRGVEGIINYCRSVDYNDYIITILDNASVDRTQILGRQIADSYPQVKYLRIEEKGVGAALRKGVEENKYEIVGYMDIDLSTDISHLSNVIDIFSRDASVDIVNGSRLSSKSETTGRKWYRNITSWGLTILLKITLKMKASDSICGFKFFRKPVIEELMREAGKENGWFYVIELLLRAERGKYKIYELPVRWQDDYNTTVHVFKLIKNYIVNIYYLRKKFKQENLL